MLLGEDQSRRKEKVYIYPNTHAPLTYTSLLFAFHFRYQRSYFCDVINRTKSKVWGVRS